ncbi:cupin [Priestia aryabhattai]|jgi:hypothetical protein|nr:MULTISPECIES: cupin [Priestia]MCM3643227.1 cupin [Priestia aryabhattai]MDH3127968.1 cupin [Priestia aryabhattai]MED3894837.1 cupin [Priestia aryabhattai]WDL85994.1 cupin [Priestia aryabhattai]SDC25147.1 hypothetical protein SAMN04487777_101295 [Priestia aryabhattai B8W22]
MMKLYGFQSEEERSFLHSTYKVNPLLSHTGDVKISFLSFQENDYTPRQEATIPQLLLVVHGEGWVAGDNGLKIYIKQGESAFWRAGESFEVGSLTAMTGLLIEGLDIAPQKLLTSFSRTNVN